MQELLSDWYFSGRKVCVLISTAYILIFSLYHIGHLKLFQVINPCFLVLRRELFNQIILYLVGAFLFWNNSVNQMVCFQPGSLHFSCSTGWEVFTLSPSSNVLLFLRPKLHSMSPSNCGLKGGAPFACPRSHLPQLFMVLGCLLLFPSSACSTHSAENCSASKKERFSGGLVTCTGHRGVWGARELAWTEEGGRTFSFSSASHGTSHGLNPWSKITVLCCGSLSFILSSVRLEKVFTSGYSLS